MKTILKTRSEEEWNGLPNKVRRWFDDALDSDDAKPSLDACIKLARELQVIANRCNNAELWRHAEAEGSEPPSLTQLKDVAGPAELKQIIEQKVINAANEALFYAEELESLGGHQFERTGVAVSLAEFQESLRRIGAVPQAILRKQGRLQEVRDVGGSQIVLRDVTALGRPTEAWHAAGRDMARAIHSAIVATGYGVPEAQRTPKAPRHRSALRRSTGSSTPRSKLHPMVLPRP